jgi:hypothetical protein
MSAKHTPGPWSHDGIDCVFAVVPQCCNRPIPHPNFDAGGNPTTVAYYECCGSPEAEQIPVASCGTNDLPIIAAAPEMLAELKHQEKNLRELAEIFDADKSDKSQTLSGAVEGFAIRIARLVAKAEGRS